MTKAELFRDGGKQWGPLTDEQRERMRVDYSPEAIARRAGLLIAGRGHDEALDFAAGCLDGFRPGSDGHVFYTRVHALIALHKEQAAAQAGEVPQLAAAAAPPAAALEEQLPGPDDLSDAAALTWAVALVQKYGEGAAAECKRFRDLHTPGTPKAAFWSRVQVEILAPRKAAAVPAEPSEPNRAAPPLPPSSSSDGERHPPQGHGADGSAGPARPWRDPDASPSHRPEPRTPLDPEQGRLF